MIPNRIYMLISCIPWSVLLLLIPSFSNVSLRKKEWGDDDNNDDTFGHNEMSAGEMCIMCCYSCACFKDNVSVALVYMTLF